MDAGSLLTLCARRVQAHANRAIFPQYSADGGWRLTSPNESRPAYMPEDGAWTAGFWPGMLWIASAVLDDAQLAVRARELTLLLACRAEDDRTHDLGFVFMPTAVLGARVSGDQSLRHFAKEAGQTLLARFNDAGGYLRAWGSVGDPSQAGLTTIDALMNAAFVMWVADTVSDARARRLARLHAENTLRHQVRSDGSTAQVARYDSHSGAYLGEGTHQGDRPGSCWSRGQAWAIYGFALFYMLTGDPIFRDASLTTSRYFMSHLRPDGMAPWDFAVAGDREDVVDSSAMAIAAAGMLLLSASSGDNASRSDALHVLDTLEHAAFVTDSSEPGLLSRGSFSVPRRVGVDASLIFGDFYFMEALARASRLPAADYLRTDPEQAERPATSRASEPSPGRDGTQDAAAGRGQTGRRSAHTPISIASEVLSQPTPDIRQERHLDALTGVFAPICTPFAEDESVDHDALRLNLELYAASGLHGYLALGSNGENRSLTEDEKSRVLDVVVRSKRPGQVVMAGVSYESQRDAQRFLAVAGDLGADYGLVLPPGYYRRQMTDDVLHRFFSALADSSPIPLLLYNAPGFSGITLSHNLVARLSTHRNIVGMKDSASEGIEHFLVLKSPSFHVLAGSANFLLSAMFNGALGGTVSLANYAPSLALELFAYGQARDQEHGYPCQDRVNQINKAVSGKHGVPGVKAAMNLLGYRGGQPRRPLLPLTAAESAELRRVIVGQGMLA